MSRLPRLYVPGLPQLILQRGHNGTIIFRDDTDFTRFRSDLLATSREVEVRIHAYVLMPDHVHFLLTPDHAEATGNFMQRLGRRYVRWFNDRYQRRGTLWEGRFRSTVLNPGEWLLRCQTYVEANPARRTLVGDAAHYAWSSVRGHLGLGVDPVLSDHALFWATGNTPFERQAAHRQRLDSGLATEDLAAIRFAAHRGWALGTMPERGEDLPNRRIAPLPKGRPSDKSRTESNKKNKSI